MLGSDGTYPGGSVCPQVSVAAFGALYPPQHPNVVVAPGLWLYWTPLTVIGGPIGIPLQHGTQLDAWKHLTN